MLKIGVCDDEENFTWELEDYILRYADKNNLKADVQTFTQTDELFGYIKMEGVFDILFLDIELGDVTGVELAKKLRQDLKNEAMQIVFVSSKQNYALQLFDIRPFNFLVKPVKYDRLEYVLNEYGRLYKFQTNYFEYCVGKQQFKISEQSIIYFQSSGRKIKMVTQDGEKEFYGKLSDILPQLNGYSFCEVHKSYIINMRYVSEYKLETVSMVNGESVPVSRSRREYLSNKILENKWGT